MQGRTSYSAIIWMKTRAAYKKEFANLEPRQGNNGNILSMSIEKIFSGPQAGAWEPERKLKLVTRGGRGEQKAFARSYCKT